MPRMIELIRKSSLSATLMHAAARGALAVPPQEMLDILVYLANHNKIFGEQARLTLAGWDENACRAAAADPNTAKEVLEYFAAPQNTRPALISSLLANPVISQEMLLQMASRGSREVAETMSESERVKASPELSQALKSNPNVIWTEIAGQAKSCPGICEAAVEEPQAPAEAISAAPSGDQNPADEEAVQSFLAAHASELAADQAKPFQPIGGFPEELTASAHAEPDAPQTVTPVQADGAGAAAAPQRAPVKNTLVNPEEGRGSALQKISRLDVKGRIQLAMKGSKEERSILVRDGTKIVALAVLDSPKIGDGEVEKIASQKNVLEAVLRAIPMKRRFAKNYCIMRNLVFNPRTPMDVSLGLMKNLLVGDLRNLSGNKEVSETVRKLALRQFKQKSDSGKRE